jgi:hypothetical protein
MRKWKKKTKKPNETGTNWKEENTNVLNHKIIFFSCKIVIFMDSALNGNDYLKYLHLKRPREICSSNYYNRGKAHKVVKKCTQKQTNQKDKAIKHKVPAVKLSVLKSNKKLKSQIHASFICLIFPFRHNFVQKNSKLAS